MRFRVQDARLNTAMLFRSGGASQLRHYSLNAQEGAISMNKKLVLLIVVLLASLLTACAGGASQGSGPATPTTARITSTPTLPPAGTVSATISGLGAGSSQAMCME